MQNHKFHDFVFIHLTDFPPDQPDVMDSDKVLYDMQMQMKKVGVVLIQGTPAEKGHVMKLSDRIGYICGTSYG